MKKCKFFALVGCLFLVAGIQNGFAKEKEVIYQPYELDKLIHEIDEPCAPIVTEDYIIFTADTNHRNVGIAFDFENYQVIHPFQILMRLDEDGNKTPVHMFYCYERKHKIQTIKYRIIMDGLWTTDPLNPDKVYDDSVNLYFSRIDNLGTIYEYTEQTKNDSVRFIYKGEPGLKLHLAGTFSNWDPWIYSLKETSPGFYELSLPLPTGKYYYNYYIGLTPVLDNTNPNKAYTLDGRSASVIVVN